MEPDYFTDDSTVIDGAIPEIVITDDAPTIARCGDCGQPCIVAGPITPSVNSMTHASPYECARGSDGAGNAWLWCTGHRTAWKLTLYRTR